MKKKSNKTTLVNFILDRSGSMESVREATISGFNEYINTLKNDGNKYLFSLVLFNTVVERRYDNEPLENVKGLTKETYRPEGNTALYDAVCSTINLLDDAKGKKVINIIMTDGEENSSKEYSESQMKKLIEEKTKQGNWTFVYLGANQDSYAKAQQYGINQMNTANFSASSAGVSRGMSTLASNTSFFAMSANSSTSEFFSKSDQTSLLDDDDKISQHFSELGKKSWDKRKKDLLS